MENIVDWHEKHKLAKSEFSCAVLSRKVLCDTSAGFIERETRETPPGSKPDLNAVIINGAIFPKQAAVLPLSTTENTVPDLTRTISAYRFFAQPFVPM